MAGIALLTIPKAIIPLGTFVGKTRTHHTWHGAPLHSHRSHHKRKQQVRPKNLMSRGDFPHLPVAKGFARGTLAHTPT